MGDRRSPGFPLSLLAFFPPALLLPLPPKFSRTPPLLAGRTMTLRTSTFLLSHGARVEFSRRAVRLGAACAMVGAVLACTGEETGGGGGEGTGGSADAGGSGGVVMGTGGAGQPVDPGTGGAAGALGSAGADAGTGGGGPLPDIKVWIAGDSTVANGNTPCPRGWGGEFQQLFTEQVTVVNRAVGGRSVQTWTYDVTDQMSGGECVLNRDGQGNPIVQDRWKEMLEGMGEGDYLIIQFGINDGSPTCPRHVGLALFKSLYGMLANAAKERGAHPIFVTPVSSIACDGSTAVGSRGSYVPATFQAGETYDVPVIDLHQRSVDLYNSLEFCPVPGGGVNASTPGPVGEFFCEDHTHFDRPGAIQIAQLVAQALADQQIGLAAYLKP